MSSAEDSLLIPSNRLAMGMYVDLELHWTKHPFAFSRFVVRSQKQIDTIRALKPDEIRVFPGRSQVDVSTEETTHESVDSSDPMEQEIAEIPEAALERERQARRRQRRAEVMRSYKDKVEKIQHITRDMRHNPVSAIESVHTLVDELARQFEVGDQLLTRLIELGGSDYRDYNHVANVSMLALMLASAEGFQGETLRRLAAGAVLHDIGKVMLPAVLLSKHEPLNGAETKLWQEHPRLGLQLAEQVRALEPEVRQIIEGHHEYLDGSGYPKGLRGEQISPLVRIVAIVNHYDNLCHPPDHHTQLAPKDALAHLYRDFENRLDRHLIQRLISVLGIYPPGTVVKLSDGRLARVIAAHPEARLAPDVIVYDPSVEKDEAAILQLSERPELEIEAALRPGEYPIAIEDYFGITEQIGFMVDVEFDAAMG